MRRLATGTLAWTMGIALVGLGSASAQEKTSSWYARLFAWPGTSAKKDAGKATRLPAETPASVLVPKTANSNTAQADYLRRMEACDRLREIALAKGDTELMRQADALEQQSWDLFVQVSNRMPDGQSLDELVLDRNLKTETPGSRRLLAIPTVFGSRKDSDGGLASRKEK